MDASKVGRMIQEAAGYVPSDKCINAGGNLGMVFIAVAIGQHAQAVYKLAEAIERSADRVAFAVEGSVESRTTIGRPG